ncbi:MAG: tetratricopeptide repeat protein [Mariniblastus sp.]
MPSRRITTFTLIFVFAFGPTLQACLWDYDTLAMERSAFPGTHELIVGHFVRHSDAYYKWRIEDRSQLPPEERSIADYDDIAVAYDKIGQHDKAIDVIKEKIARWPEQNRYESEANLGTFLIHSGDLEAGLEHIKKAIELNPDAHFGREIYQQRLVEFILFRQSDLGADPRLKNRASSFYRFLTHDEDGEYVSLSTKQVDEAIKGISGMIRFGNHDSPILLAALGSLHSHRDDSSMIAARAYLRASYETDNAETSNDFRNLAIANLEMQVSHDIGRVESELKDEIAQAKQLAAEIESDEKAWAEAGLNLDEKFKAKYYDAPSLKISTPWITLNLFEKALVGCLLATTILWFVGGCVVKKFAIGRQQ